MVCLQLYLEQSLLNPVPTSAHQAFQISFPEAILGPTLGLEHLLDVARHTSCL